MPHTLNSLTFSCDCPFKGKHFYVFVFTPKYGTCTLSSWIWDVLSRIRPFSHPGSGSNRFFSPEPRSYIKSGMRTYRYFFLASYRYAFRSKVLVLVIVKKIRDPEKIYPGSGSRLQEEKPGSGSATLPVRHFVRHVALDLKQEKSQHNFPIVKHDNKQRGFVEALRE
jgi:hypothetical protein